MDYSPPGSSIHGIFQAKILECIDMSSSRGFSRPGDWTHICLCVLNCRWILYPLSYLGSPQVIKKKKKKIRHWAEFCPWGSFPTPTLNNDKRCWSFKIYSEIRQINGVKCLNVKVAQFCLILCDPKEFSRPEHWSVSLSLLQGIFPTQRSNPGLPHCRWILYQLSHKGSP